MLSPILFLIVILLSALATVVLTPLAKRLAFALGAIDHPGGRRRVHERQVPRLGGVAIFLPVTLSLLLGLWIVPEGNRSLNDKALIGLLVASGCIFLLGVYDDIRGTNAPVKLTVQVIAAGLLYFSGVHIWEVWTPFGWMMTLGIFALPFTVLWLVGLSNGMNLLDGVDGLTAGVAAMVSLTILFISLGMGNIQLSLTAAALAGSLLGFLWFNFYPAQIFLGDCGALFLGFFLAAMSVLGNQKSASAVAMAVPIVALGIPIFDTSLAFIRRVLRGKHPFQADQDHLHHRLLALGLSQTRVVLTLYGASAFLAALALLMTIASRAAAGLIVLCLVLTIFAAAQRLRMREFKEVSCLIQYGERRRRPPRYRAMLVRNTLPLVERCESVEGLRVLLEEVRKDLGFLTLQVRFKEEAAPAILNGLTEITVADPAPPKDPDLVRQNGVPSWTGSTEILCPMWNGECGMRNHSNAECGMRNGAEHREGSGGDKGTGRQGDRETGCGRGSEPPSLLASKHPSQERAESRAAGGGKGSEHPWHVRAESREMQVVGEVVVTKPAWKRRRASENDDELLQFLADGLGGWIARKRESDRVTVTE
jgi:UDP-GlcNAc:undecaprenyl-phosphate GlcNAc-1-phosphate transferase